jgi:hypothetical protein
MSTEETIIKNKVGLLKPQRAAGQRLGGLQSESRERSRSPTSTAKLL